MVEREIRVVFYRLTEERISEGGYDYALSWLIFDLSVFEII